MFAFQALNYKNHFFLRKCRGLGLNLRLCWCVNFEVFFEMIQHEDFFRKFSRSLRDKEFYSFLISTIILINIFYVSVVGVHDDAGAIIEVDSYIFIVQNVSNAIFGGKVNKLSNTNRISQSVSRFVFFFGLLRRHSFKLGPSTEFLKKRPRLRVQRYLRFAKVGFGLGKRSHQIIIQRFVFAVAEGCLLKLLIKTVGDLLNVVLDLFFAAFSATKLFATANF